MTDEEKSTSRCTKESPAQQPPSALRVCLTRSLEVLALRLVPHVGRARRREVLAPLLAAELERAAPAGRGQARAEPRGARAGAARAVQRAPERPPARHYHQRAAAVRGRARGDGAGNDDTYMCGVCACLASRLDEWGESHRGTIERLARVRKRIRLCASRTKAERSERKSHGATRRFFPTPAGRTAGVRRAVDARSRARGPRRVRRRRGRFVRSRRARGRVAARSGFRVRRRDGRARTRERRLHRHLGGRLRGEERAASGDGALARRGATHARGGDTAARARHREAGHGHAERGGHRRRPVQMEWPTCTLEAITKTPKPRPEIKKMKRSPIPAERDTNISAESRSVRSAGHRRVNESPIPPISRLSRKPKTIRRSSRVQ